MSTYFQAKRVIRLMKHGFLEDILFGGSGIAKKKNSPGVSRP